MISQVPALLPHYRIYLQTQTSKAEVHRRATFTCTRACLMEFFIYSAWRVAAPSCAWIVWNWQAGVHPENHPTPANRSIDFLINWQRLEHDFWPSRPKYGCMMNVSLGSRQTAGSVVTAWLDAHSRAVSHWLALMRQAPGSRTEPNTHILQEDPKEPQEVQETNDSALEAEAAKSV